MKAAEHSPGSHDWRPMEDRLTQSLEWLNIEQQATLDNPCFTSHWLALPYSLATLCCACADLSDMSRRAAQDPGRARPDQPTLVELRSQLREALWHAARIVEVTPNLLDAIGSDELVWAGIVSTGPGSPNLERPSLNQGGTPRGQPSLTGLPSAGGGPEGRVETPPRPKGCAIPEEEWRAAMTTARQAAQCADEVAKGGRVLTGRAGPEALARFLALNARFVHSSTNCLAALYRLPYALD